MLDALDKRIIAAVQGDFPLVSQPYRALANQIGISEEELLTRLEKFRHMGHMRRMGAVLRHREVGYAANALCAWQIPKEKVEEVAALMVAHPAISHCYERVTHPDWPYNFYVMLHRKTRQECQEIVDQLAQTADLKDYLLLYSVREWKKTSMRYF